MKVLYSIFTSKQPKYVEKLTAQVEQMRSRKSFTIRPAEESMMTHVFELAQTPEIKSALKFFEQDRAEMAFHEVQECDGISVGDSVYDDCHNTHEGLHHSAAMTVGTQAATPVTADLERLNDVGTALKSRPRKDQPPRMRLWMQSATNVWADAA